MKKKKNHLSSRQCTVPQVNENNGQIRPIWLPSASTTGCLRISNGAPGKRFGFSEEVIAASEAYFEAKDK